jgi:hypothetical protein
MLYDPKWEKTVNADPLSLGSLIAWLETQDPRTRYDFCQFSECLLGRWLRSIDPEARTMFDRGAPTGYFYSVFGKTVNLAAFTDIAVGDGCHERRSHTFGAALKRARSMPSPIGTKS